MGRLAKVPKNSRSPGRVRREKTQLSNIQIVTLAIYLMGGESRPVPTEDVAYKANEIAPGRFTWKKYRDQINIDDIRKRLSDAKKTENGGYIQGSFTHGWVLTEGGLRFAKENSSRVKDADLSRPRLTLQDRKWRSVERNRMLASDAYLKFREAGIEAVSRREAEVFFRIDEYVRGDLREQKIVRLSNVFYDDPELGIAIRALAAKVRRE